MSGPRVRPLPRSLSGRDAADAPLYALHQQPVAFAHRRLPGLRSHPLMIKIIRQLTPKGYKKGHSGTRGGLASPNARVRERPA